MSKHRTPTRTDLRIVELAREGEQFSAISAGLRVGHDWAMARWAALATRADRRARKEALNRIRCEAYRKREKADAERLARLAAVVVDPDWRFPAEDPRAVADHGSPMALLRMRPATEVRRSGSTLGPI